MGSFLTDLGQQNVYRIFAEVKVFNEMFFRLEIPYEYLDSIVKKLVIMFPSDLAYLDAYRNYDTDPANEQS